jgi:hypothetical protein
MESKEETNWPPPRRLALLRRCLAPEVKRLGVGAKVGPTLQVRYRGTGPALRLALEGALPVPKCAAEWFRQVPPPDVGAGWKLLELPLK